MKKLLSFALALILCVLCTVPAFAAGSTPLTQPGTNYQGYSPSHTYSGNWATTTKFYLFANASGGLTRVEAPNVETSNLRVEEYDSSFRFLSGRLLAYDGLPLWGGFYAGTNYNFIITGQENRSESDSVEVIRVLKYSKDWQYLGKASVYGADTFMPFDAGTVNCVESGGILHVYTCHEMYSHGDGKNHQSNMEITIQESDMNVTEVTKMNNRFFFFVSHSFNQFVLVDSQGNLVTADHGDGNPRAMEINILFGKGGSTMPNNSVKDGDRIAYIRTDAFPGESGDNNTGAMLGGLAETSNGYLLAYAQ
ncbi:MAG: hypothetical protein K2O18_17110, partial [Oscillospiraceae bacterium]|nr:hypothetical protein [Oscillospiraceae bacterium]